MIMSYLYHPRHYYLLQDTVIEVTINVFQIQDHVMNVTNIGVLVVNKELIVCMGKIAKVFVVLEV
jgi:hypothetical protein